MECPECPLEWDRKSLSREAFFTRTGMGLDPGNIVYASMLYTINWMAGADAERFVEKWPTTCDSCDRSQLLGVAHQLV